MVSNQTKEVDLLKRAKEWWQLTLHRKWVILLAGVVLSATAVVLIALMPNWYSASITVSVDPQKMPERYVSSSVMMDQLRFDTLTEEVLSTPRLQQIIDEMRLYPDLRACMTQQDVIEYMRKNITIVIKQGGDRNLSAFTIKFIDKNRQLVAPVATRLADSFIEWDLTTREHQAVGASDFLATQLGEARKSLEDEETKVNNFRHQHLGELPEQAGANSAALARLQTALQANIDNLNRLEQEKILLAEPGNLNRQVSLVPSERGRLEEQQRKLEDDLADLRSHYSDEYPDVEKATERLAAVRQKLARLPSEKAVTAQTSDGSSSEAGHNLTASRLLVTNNEVKRLQESQKDILSQIKQYQAKIEATPLHEQALVDLERDYQSSKLHYQSLLDKRYAADLAEDMERRHEVDRFSVLEPAQIPEKPFKPHRLILVLVLVPACFLFSAALAIISDLVVRGSIATERALKALLPASVPILGRIPDIETPQNTNRQRKLAALTITSSVACCLAVALVLWKLHLPV